MASADFGRLFWRHSRERNHPSIYIVMTSGKHGPFWTLQGAIDGAKELEEVRRTVTKIERRGEAVLEDEALKRAMVEI